MGKRLEIGEVRRPGSWLSDEMLEKGLVFLDELRISGKVNMLYSTGYVQTWWKDVTGKSKLSRNAANQILKYWLATFHERHPDA